jgi:DNA-3-methyladenine glycosylase II
MFLIFSLRRDDVFSYGDLGLRNAMKKIYNMKNPPTPAQAERITAKWKPSRSLGSRYLWASLKNK